MTNKAKKPPTDAQMKAKALARWDTEGGAPASEDVISRKQSKRPRDSNQLAKSIVDQVVSDGDRRERAERDQRPEKVSKVRKTAK